jgi:dual-specificity kinase
MWSIGCILVEFCTGDALFQTHDNLEHMAMMEPICGKINAKMMRAANKATQQKLFKDYKLDYPNSETTKQSRKYVKAMKPLKVLIPPTTQSDMFQEMIRPDTEMNRELLDLLQKIFVYDPTRRITAGQALRHRYFRLPATDDFK